MAWRLYYGDGDTSEGFSRDDWLKSPARNVVGLVQSSDRVGRTILPADYFHWPPWLDRPFGTDQWGVIDHLLEIGVMEPSDPISSVPPNVLFANGIKLGRMLNNNDWQKIWVRMTEDPGFPRKSNPEKWERVPK